MTTMMTIKRHQLRYESNKPVWLASDEPDCKQGSVGSLVRSSDNLHMVCSNNYHVMTATLDRLEHLIFTSLFTKMI